MKICIIAVGNIGSGKSTLAKKFVKDDYVIISRDSLRYSIGAGNYIFNKNFESAIFKTETDMFRNFIALEVNVFVDEVGVTRNLRKKYIDILKNYEDYAIVCYELPKYSKQECVDRRMNDPHGQYDRILWESIWENFNAIYERPELSEGFDVIYRL